VKFAGPDISNKLDYLTAFAAEAPRHRDVILLTGHYYAMGPAGSPDATLEQLMEPDPKTATLHLAGIPTVQAAIRTARLPVRMCEGNSCWDGGKPGVSDTLASALWCADTMLRFAQYGWVGVNWHGGGNGHYAPIAGSPSAGLVRRPEYYGIQFAQKLVGATFLPVAISGAGRLLTAYAFRRGARRSLVLINKDLAALTLTLPAPVKPGAWILTGPARDAREGTRLERVTVPAARRVTVPAHSALLFSL
jgi:hypothetical protein